MKIAIDIDGTLFDIITPILREYNKKFNTDYKPADITKYKVQDCLDVNMEYFRYLIDQVWIENYKEIEMYEPNMVKKLNSLRPQNKIIILTKRNINTIPYVVRKLEKCEIEVDGLVVVNNGLEKSLAKVDCLLDDDREVIDEFGSKGYLIKRIYNKVYDVESLEHFINIVEGIKVNAV